MLSESEKLILSQNDRAQLALFGQEYNDESWAICCSDMLIKDEDTANIVLGDTLGDGKTKDGFEGERFHYLMANPPFGVEWKDQKDSVMREHKIMGFSGRFGAGLPAINDGSLLFLQHMISKMHPYKKGDEDQPGSKIAIVFNGSPLFSGDAGSGPSNIRRWIIENDWLDTIVAMPDQLFYNTGIFTYVWLVTNRKPLERRGKVQLIDGTRFFQKMQKSLNNKRNEISEEQIRLLTRVYGNYRDGETAEVQWPVATGWPALSPAPPRPRSAAAPCDVHARRLPSGAPPGSPPDRPRCARPALARPRIEARFRLSGEPPERRRAGRAKSASESRARPHG